MTIVEANGATHSGGRARHLGAARARLRARGRAGAAARLSSYRHRRDVRQRARGRRGPARVRRQARRGVHHHQGVADPSRAAANSSAPTKESLVRLRLSEVDLLLIHWPNPHIPLAETIGALCKMKSVGLCAPYRRVELHRAAAARRRSSLATEPLVTNQIEWHPYLDQSAVVAATRQHGLVGHRLQPDRARPAAGDAKLDGDRHGAHGKTAGQVCLRFLVQEGAIVIPRTSKVERLTENIVDLRFRAQRRRDGRDPQARAPERPHRRLGRSAEVGLNPFTRASLRGLDSRMPGISGSSCAPNAGLLVASAPRDSSDGAKRSTGLTIRTWARSDR